MQRTTVRTLFLIFALSGFSGLIYESIWTHYLKLFLGHAAYAQTLVLAIFMGGMAFGSWICGARSVRWKNLLLGYALAEGAIGVLALLFHDVFDLAIRASYTAILPHVPSPALTGLYTWGLSALLILPQSTLLGMTFPLMSAGIVRLEPRGIGRTVSLLYFTNSIGAAIGVLASGFVLVRLLGLPGTMRTAGVINIGLALAVWFLMKDRPAGAPSGTPAERYGDALQDGGRSALFLVASFITGAASFIYEIVWIRMLSLVLGSSTHAFELMLSAFIFGLAVGGLWIRRRIDRLDVPGRFLAHVQVLMGILALSTLALYDRVFDIMQWLVHTLGKTGTGYDLFNLSSIGIALLLMVPTTVCAGMTLPLITTSLVKQGYGEKSFGAVYAANTVGAIAGVSLAIHAGMPLLGLKGLLTFGAGLDIGLGVLLAWTAAGYATRRMPSVVTAAGIAAVAATVAFVQLDPYKMASGVYREGILYRPENVKIVYHRDGKTATISSYYHKGSGSMAIATNGKPDAAVVLAADRPPSMDEPTMILAAVMAMAHHSQARTAANIGLGSGLTTQTLLGNPRLERVDTVEIERFVVDAANHFRPRVDLVYTDPRSAMHVDDAKVFFAVRNRRYDIIISEPSNPWVSGVASLFTDEFYRLINRHLSDDGVFVQWIQLYEINVDLVMSVLKAVSANFSDFVVYATNNHDALIVARKRGAMPGIDGALLRLPAISGALQRVFIRTIQDIEVRRIGDRRFLADLIASFPLAANSDYYPVLDQEAARARFLQANAYPLLYLSHGLLPAYELLTGTAPSRERTEVSLSPLFTKSQAAYTAMALRDHALEGRFGPRYGTVPPVVQRQAALLTRTFSDCRQAPDPGERFSNLVTASVELIPYLTPKELDAVWRKWESSPCARALSHAERAWLDLCKAAGKRDPEGMVRRARAVLEGGPSTPPLAARFALAAGMTGSLLQGNAEDASGFWRSYGPRVVGKDDPDLLFRLLEARSRSPR